jgi:hypothetical protein
MEVLEEAFVTVIKFCCELALCKLALFSWLCGCRASSRKSMDLLAAEIDALRDPGILQHVFAFLPGHWLSAESGRLSMLAWQSSKFATSACMAALRARFVLNLLCTVLLWLRLRQLSWRVVVD